MKKRAIHIHSGYVAELADEFETTTQTVRMALVYFNNSDLAVKIREKAKEYLKSESNKPLHLDDD